MEPHDGAVGHHGRGHYAGGLSGGEESEPALHDVVQRKDPCRRTTEQELALLMLT